MVETKYRVWSVFMFVFSGLFILETLALLGVFFWSLTELSYYRSYISMAAMGRISYEIYVIVFVILILFFAFISFMNLHGGIILRRRQIRGKGVYVFYGIVCILGAIYYAISFFWFLIQGIDKEPAFLILAMPMLLYLSGCVITTIMMFSKISSGTERKKNFNSLPKTDTSVGAQGCVRFLSGEYAGNAVNMLGGQRMILGSDAAQANLVLQNGKVSPYHCLIEYAGGNGNFQITDYSASGTYVNGTRLNTGVVYTVQPQSIVAIAEGEIQIQLD